MEEFKLDALDNLREYIDKGGDSWTFSIDSAGRKVEEATPPVRVTTVTAQGNLIDSKEKKRIIKKIEYFGLSQRITEGYGTDNARSIELYHNPFAQVTETKQINPSVYNPGKNLTRILDEDYISTPKGKQGATSKQRMQSEKELKTQTVYNTFKKPIVTMDEAGNPQFKVYKKDQLCYEIDQEAYVTHYEYNVFGNVVKLTRYANPLTLNLKAYALNGIPLTDVQKSIVTSNDDRSVIREFDRLNRPVSVSFDKILVVIPNASNGSQHGDFSPKKVNQYNAFGEIIQQSELVDPINGIWHSTKTWHDKAGHLIAQVDGLNYLTLFQNDRDGNNTKVIEYAKKLKKAVDSSYALRSVLTYLELDSEQDRIYTNEFDARGDLTKSIQHKVRLADASINPETTTLVTRYVYNAKGYVVLETGPKV